MSHPLFKKHQALLDQAIIALKERKFFTPYPEHPKAYEEGGNEEGKASFSKKLNTNYLGVAEGNSDWIGEEISPYWQTGLGIQYPKENPQEVINKAKSAFEIWKNTSIKSRAGILIESLERVKSRFFELAYATMHTTGQSFLMSFQASGPHANDRALEAIAKGYEELLEYPEELTWTKPMGKFDLALKKTFKPVPKGIGLVIGCSTFPTWNTVPGLFANLMTGNVSIVKPHPKAIMPIAILIEELRNVCKENKLPEDIVQLAVDTVKEPITKIYAEHSEIKLIDYTGSSSFGDYLEGLQKTCFTEKSGVNSIILESAQDLKSTCQNIAFSASLYSGQMCTAPQNIFVPETGIETKEGKMNFEEVLSTLTQSMENLVTHPKMGPGTLGAIQNDNTLVNIDAQGDFGGKVILEQLNISNPEFASARIASPKIVVLNATQATYQEEFFGPVLFVIKCKNKLEALQKIKELAESKGAITCSAYTLDEAFEKKIEEEMNSVFTPVSFNFSGPAFINQHAAFSDFHVTGGNPAGNASFTNSNFINRRFVWVGNRYMPNTL
ncbi:MAG: 1-pyrroline-5-carboxylate dehydrogenase 2 [Bacteroidetes bacterium MED-G17]|nr:MAG: 1-pyrroline-5-carboxylate dehydrogenase 2 [Bacteroidetes bacterium MED-G17]|tara:strand:+ start:3992 stop:5653 length:1662 start_codon:yes stop_codon:yes gene_type:complete